MPGFGPAARIARAKGDVFRRVNRTSVKVFVKDAAKILARRVLGLDVRLARSREYDLRPYEHNLKHVGRFMHFQDLIRKVSAIDGSIVECGVGPGMSLFEFAAISAACGRPRRIYGYDTFEGLPNPTQADGEWNSRIGGFWSCSREQVRRQLLLAGLDCEYISKNVTVIPGEISQTLRSYDEGPIALLHLDVDIYESYKTALENLYEHVAGGGVLAFDEYNLDQWPGATKAIDEFFEDKPEEIVRSPYIERYYAVKCG